MRVSSALSTARQAAITKGETVNFRIKQNRVRVFAVSDSNTNLLPAVPLDTLYDVRTTVNNSSAEFNAVFNARGFANINEVKKVRLTRSGVADDSVTILLTGMVQR